MKIILTREDGTKIAEGTVHRAIFERLAPIALAGLAGVTKVDLRLQLAPLEGDRLCETFAAVPTISLTRVSE